MNAGMLEWSSLVVKTIKPMRYKIITRIVCRLIRLVTILYAAILIIIGFNDFKLAFGNIAVCVGIVGLTTMLIRNSNLDK